MPYKNIEDRRSAWVRWAKRNKDKKRENDRRYQQSKYHNPNQQLCQIEECHKPGERHHPDPNKYKNIIWLCKAHHEMEHHKEERKCNIPECYGKHLAKGLCRAHYKQERRRQGITKNRV